MLEYPSDLAFGDGVRVAVLFLLSGVGEPVLLVALFVVLLFSFGVVPRTGLSILLCLPLLNEALRVVMGTAVVERTPFLPSSVAILVPGLELAVRVLGVVGLSARSLSRALVSEVTEHSTRTSGT